MRTLTFILIFACKLTFFAQNSTLKKTLQLSDSLEHNQEYVKAIAIWKENKTNSKLSQAYLNYLLFNQNKTEKSIHSLQKAKELLINIQNRKPFETELLLKIYKAQYTFLNENNNGKKAIEKALEGFRLTDFEQAKTTTQINYLLDISALYRDNENRFEAVFFGEKALLLTIKKHGQISNETANNYNLLGDAYIESYNPIKGILYFEKAITIWESSKNKNPEETDKLLTAYRNLMIASLEYGDREKAKKINQKQNTLFFKQFKKHQNATMPYFHARQMQIHSNVVLNAALGNFKKATLYCDSLKAETKYKKQNKEAVAFVVMSYFDLLDYTYEYKQYTETINRCYQLQKTIEEYDLGFPKMLIHAKMGTSYEKIKNYKKALYHIKIAEAVVDKENFNSSKFSIQIIKAIILSGMNKNQDAVAIGKNTLEQIVFEKTQKRVGLNQIKFEDVADLADTYFINIFEKVADLYLKNYELTKDKQALKKAENLYQISGKLFQKHYLKGEFNDFLSYYHLEITEGLLQCLLLKNATFEQKITILNTIERNASQHLIKEYDKKIKRSNNFNTAIAQQIKSLQSELDYYLQLKNTTQKEVAFNKKRMQILQSKINELTKEITKTEKNFGLFNANNFDLKTTLSHLKTNQQLIKYYVCRQFVYAIYFTNSSIKIKKIGSREKVQEQLTNFVSEIKTLQPNYTKSASQLYTTMFPFLLQKNITLIPDSFLNYLPFEALFNPEKEQYTVQNHIISYDYSLPMWDLHQRYKITKKNQSLAAFSPFYKPSSANVNRADFKELKFAHIESQKITDFFGGKLFAHNKATKVNFIREKENYDIFHLAMHSQLFEDDFNKSFLLFSNNEKLFFSDLYGMNIPASMVVLSACDTGNGITKNGEGIMSMSRALAYAGVKSAVVSLWKVPDRETSEIMILFYENLKKGQTKDQALANAKTIFIKNNPMKKHPYYWAGFIVNGDVTPLVYTSYNWVFWIFGILIIGFLLFYYRKKLIQVRK